MDISEKQRQLMACSIVCFCWEIMEPCPNLAAVLMLGGQQLQGCRLNDYLACRDDKDSSVAAMAGDISEAEPSGTPPPHFKGACQVHAYHTNYDAKDGSRYHIVGIVKAKERGKSGSSGATAFWRQGRNSNAGRFEDRKLLEWLRYSFCLVLRFVGIGEESVLSPSQSKQHAAVAAQV